MTQRNPHDRQSIMLPTAIGKPVIAAIDRACAGMWLSPSRFQPLSPEPLTR